MTMYAHDNNDYIVAAEPEKDISWAQFYAEYMNNANFANWWVNDAAKLNAAKNLAIFHCPAIDWDMNSVIYVTKQVYGANFALFGGLQTGNGYTEMWGKVRPLHRTNVKASDPTLEQSNRKHSIRSILYADSFYARVKTPTMVSILQTFGVIGLIHNMRANALLLDGSVIGADQYELGSLSAYGYTAGIKAPWEL